MRTQVGRHAGARRWFASLLVVASGAGCRITPPVTAPILEPAPATPAPAVSTSAADTSMKRPVPGAIRWYRASAERRAVYLQTYALATASLERRAAGLPNGSWAVILDADETVLDNSPEEQASAEQGLAYSAARWGAWVRREAAPALPGAAAFVARAHSLGGRVVIVTNRDSAQCDPTRRNLAAVGIAADEVLCRTDKASDSKDPRFAAVIAGTPPSTLPPLRVLMWVGDNIQDFPHLTQAVRTQGDEAFRAFGDSLIVLPNPMYGSWEKNALP